MKASIPAVSLLAIMLLTIPALPALAQAIPNAAGKAAENAEEKDQKYETRVEGSAPSETDLVGPYKQPSWSTRRTFGNTRIYVLPAGTVNIDIWWNPKGSFGSGQEATNNFSAELEIGLGKHVQGDIYFNLAQKGYSAPLEFGSIGLELRFAFADWGVAWGNPAIYLEYLFQNNGPQKGEIKLLLGDQIGKSAFWGLNLVYEREFGSPGTQEIAATYGMSWIVIDKLFLCGFETRFVYEDEQAARWTLDEGIKFLAGPTFQVRPFQRVYIDLLPRAGFKIAESESSGGGKNFNVTGVYEGFLTVGVELL